MEKLVEEKLFVELRNKICGIAASNVKKQHFAIPLH